ncbi:L,D-transpeptidase family protein [Limoniibacter endophyticus]|uniref:Amidase n=1 Tax=Limoniibacter endophyticus TaxID=1565040 RepID=A0A8J3DLN5_9HYPH|nr:L,D-transpeptidase family protein [Limoniibacter endophyticus]GHC68367.1 amidase [Limoniibacter endophyticus]
MSINRRFFIAGTGAVAATAITAASAHAQDVLQNILNSPRRGNWDDQFDARGSQQVARVASTLPIMSMETIMYTEQAIAQHNDLAAQGGWNLVPATKKLEIGVSDPDVVPLRQRLMISGDLPQSAGISPAFDTYVDAAVKRFQARHGLPEDGVMGEFSYKAMNIPVQTRLMQLQRNLQRLREESNKDYGGRYVLVNIPAANIEAVEGPRVVSRHTGIVGKIDRQTPILDSKINEIIINPYWHAPVSIVRKDIIPLMRKDPTYLERSKIKVFGPNQQEIDPSTIDWNTEEAARYLFRQEPGDINAMASVKINFPNSHAVYMHDTPQQSLFWNLMRFDSSGCVRVQNVRDLVTWILRDTPGWERANIERQMHSGENKPIPVSNPVPVHFKYISAWSTGNGVTHFRDDIYAMDGAAELQISTL